MNHARPDWFDRAACLGVDPDIFFPAKSDDEARTRAKAICQRCPVQLLCCEHALATNAYGIWGGTTRKERTVIRKERRAA